MKSAISIALYDSNLFFLHGLQHLFKMYFKDKGIPVIFTPTANACGADLVVNSCSALKPCEPVQLKITLRRKNYWGEYSYHQGEVGYYAKPESVALLLDELFNTPMTEPMPQNALSEKVGIRITRREKEVLREIVTELSAVRIAKKLQISIKTVSAHKHSAMRKLGFRNSQELYIWLLQLKRI